MREWAERKEVDTSLNGGWVTHKVLNGKMDKKLKKILMELIKEGRI